MLQDNGTPVLQAEYKSTPDRISNLGLFQRLKKEGTTFPCLYKGLMLQNVCLTRGLVAFAADHCSTSILY
jgi:hypothetical protein